METNKEPQRDTPITHLRNLFTPFVTYFDLLKLVENGGFDDDKKVKLLVLLEKSKKAVYDNFDETVSIIKQIPNDAIEGFYEHKQSDKENLDN